MKRYIVRTIVKSNGQVIQSRETSRTSANKLAKKFKEEFGDQVVVNIHQVGIMTATLMGTELN